MSRNYNWQLEYILPQYDNLYSGEETTGPSFMIVVYVGYCHCLLHSVVLSEVNNLRYLKKCISGVWFIYYKVFVISSLLPGILEPHPRSGHRIVVDECNVYSVGGYNPDFWGLENIDDSTCFPLFKEVRRWRQKRYCLKLCISDLLYFYVFISLDDLFSLFMLTCASFLFQLWKFNLINRRWTKLDTTGDMPNELASHSGETVPH